MSALIEFDAVCKYYQMGDTTVKAADHITMKIEKGEFVAIVGQSGSGKSTCMNIIGCLDVPTAGTYRLNGRDVGKMNRDELADVRNEMLGFIFQQYNLLPKLNLLENVEVPLVYAGIGRAERHARAKEVLEQVGLGDKLRNRPNQLSGGQQQRVAIARAIVNEPEVLLLDEPTTGLDPNQIVEIRELIKNIGREKTVIMSSHILAEIEATCDRVLIINKGKIVADGTSAELRNKSDKGKLLKICIQGGEDEDIYNELALIPELENIISSTPHHFEIQCERATEIEKKIFDICCQNNWYISEMTPVETRLEDIFRQVTKN